jgi:hypothetical protein
MIRTAKSTIAMVICAAAAGLLALQQPAIAQQKTVKACQEEWRANRQANQAAGITQKAFVDKCRSGQALNQPSGQAPPAPGRTTGAAPPASPDRTTGAAPPASPNRTTVAPPPASPNRTIGLGTPAGAANQFSTEAQAKAQCGPDTVVWANLQSKIYHFAGNKDFGTTKSGAFMCERQATAQGIRAAKNEKHP